MNFLIYQVQKKINKSYKAQHLLFPVAYDSVIIICPAEIFPMGSGRKKNRMKLLRLVAAA